MQTIIIECPKCKSILEVKNSKGEESKIIKCPTCSSQLRVKFEPQEPIDVKTDLGGGYNDTDKTEIADRQVYKKAFLVCEGKRYELTEGRHIVGRMAKNSTADVQIKTDDLFMSRHNAIINVRKTSKGLVVSIANHKNLNPNLVGKEKLLDGNEIVIRNGDPITMGKTIVTLLLE